MTWRGQAARFGAVGVIQNGINVGAFALMTAVGFHYRWAAVLAALLAFVVSFVLNRHWTFMESATPVGRQGARYLFVFTAAVALGVVLLTVFVEVTGMAEVPAQVAAILIVAPLSFLAQRSWVFGRRPQP